MKTQTPQMEVEEGRTKLTVVHKGEKLTFIHPYFSHDTYAHVGDKINSVKDIQLKKPTIAQTTSLVHAAFISDDRYSQEIKEFMKHSWLWAFTGILYVPKEGAYFEDDPEVKDGMPYIERSKLIEKLEKKDPSVRFVPFGFETGEMTPSALAKNEFIIGWAGEEGAEKLAEVAGMFRSNPVLCGFESADKLEIRVSTLGSYWDFYWLNVSGGSHGNDRFGFAFGYVPKKSP